MADLRWEFTPESLNVGDEAMAVVIDGQVTFSNMWDDISVTVPLNELIAFVEKAKEL